ncbi:MAG: T9SS type A sorting domain-containing protein [Chlorobi bacterium]|nr:T9SS type A sorting domain-containing protein [Chlorobiota bacterium]
MKKVALWLLGLVPAFAQNPVVWVDTLTQVEATDVCAFYDLQSGTIEDLIIVGEAYDTINGNFHYVMSINHFGYDVVNRGLNFYSQNSFWSLNGVYSIIQYFTIGESPFCLVEDSLLVLNSGVDTIGRIFVVFSGIEVTGGRQLYAHRLTVNRGVNKSIQSDNLFSFPLAIDIANHYANRYGASSSLTIFNFYVSDIFQVRKGRWLILVTWSGSLSVPSNSRVPVKGWSLVELFINPTNGNPTTKVLYTSPVHDASETYFGQPIEVRAPYRAGNVRYGFSRQGPFRVWQASDKVVVVGVLGNSSDTLFLDFLRTKTVPGLPNGLGTLIMLFDTLTYSLQDYLAITPVNYNDSVDIVPMGLLFDSTSVAFPVKVWYGWLNRGDKPMDSIKLIRNGFVSKKVVDSQSGIKTIYLSLSGNTMEFGLPFSGEIRIEGLEGFAAGEGVAAGVIMDSANVPRWSQYRKLNPSDTVVWLGRMQISGNSLYGYIIFSKGDPEFRGGGLRKVVPVGDGTVLALGMTARWDLKDHVEFWAYDLENGTPVNVLIRDVYGGQTVDPYYDFLRYGGSWWIASLPCGTFHPVWEEVGLVYDTIGCNVYLMGPQYSFPPYDIRLYGHPPMDSMVLIAPGGCRYLHPGPYSIWLADTTILPTTVSCNIIRATEPALMYYLYTPSGPVDSSAIGEFEILEGGTYWIVGLDTCDVKISDSISIEIFNSGKRLGLKGIPSSKGGSYVLYGPSTISNVTIMDVYGHVIPVEIALTELQQNYCEGKEYVVEIPPLPPGVYVLSIEGKTKHFTLKIVVQ